MALASRKRTATPPTHGGPCSIGAAYRHVADNAAELAELNSILYEENNTQPEAHKILSEDGDFPFKIGFQTINKHRGMKCRCFREAPYRFCHECRRDLPSCVCDAA